MSVLVILMPPRARDGTATTAADGYDFVLSDDGRSVTRQGRAAAAALPRADQACLLLADSDVSWLRTRMPKAPAARRRAALGAVLEEQLLDEDEDVHLALETGLAGGGEGWVAALRRDWLQTAITALEGAGIALARVAPSSWPGAAPQLHVLAADDEGQAPLAVFSHADGVACVRLAGSLAQQRLQGLDRQAWRCSAHPSAVAAAEHALQALALRVDALSDAERALQALASPWNLRQFELAPQHRGLQRLRTAQQRLAGREWRAWRWGLAAALLAQLAGLNAYAWKLEREVRARQQAQAQLLQQAHPQVRSVLDAPLQMQRETERLRAAAGELGASDFEPLFDAVASAWPDGLAPLQALRYADGRLSLVPAAGSEGEREPVLGLLRAAGLQVHAEGSDIVVRAGAAP